MWSADRLDFAWSASQTERANHARYRPKCVAQVDRRLMLHERPGAEKRRLSCSMSRFAVLRGKRIERETGKL